jgi:hypothetical protein
LPTKRGIVVGLVVVTDTRRQKDNVMACEHLTQTVDVANGRVEFVCDDCKQVFYLSLEEARKDEMLTWLLSGELAQ